MDYSGNPIVTQDMGDASANGLHESTDDAIPKPCLFVDKTNPDTTVAALRDLLAERSDLYDRGVPVRLALDQVEKGAVAQVVTPYALILEAHRVCRPYAIKKSGETDVGLSSPFARMYLDWQGEWNLPPFNGVTSAPLLQDDGAIAYHCGYDNASGMWCQDIPDLAGQVRERPARSDAEAALTLIRETFKTFCFADAEMLEDPDGVLMVDTGKSPGHDESAFLVALLTAVCRPSLQLCPGILVRAPSVSGAGAGKGLLVRCICRIAFGRDPHAVTAGSATDELEKRIAAELMGGSPVLFLDNLNNVDFKSDLLASAITERPARVRLLGKSQMVPLNASAFVALTGNGLTVSEDLARRFLVVELDPRTEDPEARSFRTDIRAHIKDRRSDLLAALLTIWRWGRLSADVPQGMPLGSFEEWGRWVRDPLLALGCQDPAARVRKTKQADGHRDEIAELFQVWWDKHSCHPVTATQLHEDVRRAIDSQGRGRQYVAYKLKTLAGTRLAGFVLTRQLPVGAWGATTYALTESHRN